MAINQFRNSLGAACCPFHALALGYAGAPRCTTSSNNQAPRASFSDSTAKLPSDFCRSTDGDGLDLVELADSARPLTISGVTVIPMTGCVRLFNRDVEIRGDRITSIKPHSPKEFGANDRVIDGAGLFLAPGLADMHAHPNVLRWVETMLPWFKGLDRAEPFTLPAGLLMLQQLVAGVTRLDVMAGEPDILHLRDAIRSGRIAGPVMRVGSPIIDGPQPLQSPKMSWLCADADAGREAARLLFELGYDFAKPYNNLPVDAYFALLDACDAHSIPVLGHIPLDIGVEAAVDLGRQSIAHVAELFHWLEGPARSDTARIEKLAKRLVETQQWVQLTTVVTSRYESILNCELNGDQFPDTAFCNPLINKIWDPNTPAMKAIRERPHRKVLTQDATKLAFQASKLLHEMGVRLVTGSDAPNAFLADGFSIHEELETLVERGVMSPYEALKLVTVNAAEQHGETGVSGVVAEGAFADLILLRADPLLDIRATRQIAGVWARGAYLSETAIDAAKERILAALRAMPVPA